MKNNILKSLFIALTLILGVNNAWAATFSGGEILVLKPNSNWTKDGARFAAYFFGNGEKWVSMTAVSINGTSGYYQVTAPSGGYKNVIFCRMNGSAAANNWNNKWNQSGDLTYDGTKNVFTVPSGAWDGSTTGWGNQTITVTLDAQSGTGGTASIAVNYGEDERPSVTAPTRTGYDFGGFYTSTGGGGSQVINASNAWQKNISDYVDANGRWIKNAACTLYAKWIEKTYSLTFKHDGNGTIQVGGATVNSGSNATINHVTTKTLVATPNTGYNFSGWTLSGSNTNAVTIDNTSAASTAIKATNTGATVTANFTPKTYAITLNANGGTSNGQATATYKSSSITNITHPTRTDHRCNGYYTAASGGTLVLNTDGTLAKSVSGYTDADGNWIKDGTATLYAQWTYDVTEYTVTFGAGTDFTSYGSVTAYNNTTSASITSPATVRSGQSITFTATPETGYEVEGWYTNAACTAGKHDAGQTTYTTSITGITNVYVKFVEKTWSVAFAAGTGGSVTKPSSTPKTVGQLAGITIIAETNEGYTFAGWTSSNGGRFDDARAEKTDFYPTAATTVTANFTENLHTIAVQTSNNEHGTVSPASVEVGVATTTEITATPNAGYMFDKWIAAGGASVADPTSATTTVTATAEGNVTAYFKEIPPTTIYFKPNDDWKKDNANFAINYWNNTTSGFADMTELDCEGKLYSGQVPTGFTDMKIQRVKVDPNTKYYITGSSDLVGQAKAWKETAVEMTYDANKTAFTYTFSNLAPGIAYKMKLTNGSWANSWGYNALKNSSANITSDNDNNIVFKLPYGGDVVVKFDGTNVTISGFFVKDDATPQKYGSAVPGQCHDVMLQGFYWDSNQDKYYGNTRWSTLQGEAADISTYFDLLWLPPSAMSSGGVGYHPKQYSNQNSDWGSRKDLEKLISMLHAGGTKVVADMVVNHLDTKSSWCDFYDQDFGEYGYFQPDGSYICNNDEMNWDADEGCRGTATGSYDDGYGGESNYGAARDMAHNDEKVRQMFRAYAKWMVDVMKYDGFRYDYAKGFHMSHIDDYNANAGVYFSVVEFWEGNPNSLWSAICDANQNTYAFDFGMKFNVMNGGIANFDYAKCKNPNALIGIGKGKWAVNFIDNHDTFERDDNSYDFGGDAMSDDVRDRLLQAHAYMLAMPGVPCVFYPYWKKYKDAIAPMVLARKAVGVHSESGVSDEVVGNGYRAHVYGSKGELILELGAAVSDSHYGFREVAAGPGYKMFITYEAAGAELTVSPQSTYYRSQTMNVTMNAVGLAGVPDIYYTLDGTDPRTSASKKKYTGEISISGTVTVKAYAEIHGNQTAVQTHTYTYYPPQEEPLTVRFLPPNDWWTYVYAWDKNDNKLLGNWPGTEIEPNANGWVEYTFAAGKNPVNLIFHNNVGAQSHDIVLEEDACYIWNSSLGDAVLTNECNIIDTGSSAPADPEQGYTPKLLLEETLTLSVPQNDNNLYDMDSKNITHLYLAPNMWNTDNAWYAAYFFGNGEKWIKMLDEDGDGIYSCEIPTDKTYPSVIFVRMDKDKSELGWSSKWNQSGDLIVPTDGKNLFTVSAWDGATTSWSTIYDNSKWTTFTAPTYSFTIKITGYGSIEIDGETYTNNSEEQGTYTAPNITLNELMQIGAITPANEWTYGVTPTIIIGSRTHEVAENTSYTICGTTIIDIIFSPSICEVKFDLNLPQGVTAPLWTIDNQRINPGDTVVTPKLGELPGYFFGGWYTHATDFSNKNQYDFSMVVTKPLTLYARWLKYEDCIFFKNNLGWESVYAYFYNSDKYWDDTKGTGSQKLKTFPQDNDAEHKPHWFEFQGELSNIPETDIWYLDFIAMAIAVDANNWGEITGYTNISFTEHKQYNYEFFHQTSVVRRGDFNRNMSLFIPEAGQTPTTRNESKYYNHGLWMKYNSIESGYNWRGSANSWSTSANAFTADKAGGYTFTSLVRLTGGTNYEFKIFGNDTWFGNTGTMTEDNCTNWHFTTDEKSDAKIHPTATGDYLFTIYVGDGKMMVSLEYPLSIGDYRLAYKDSTAGSFHPSHYIKKRNEGQNDTISFFVRHDKQPQIIVQRCSVIVNDGTATWETLNIGNVNPAYGLTETGVYNFYLQQIQGQTNPRLLAQTQPYTGDFYIRTESADGGWKFFRQSSNLMTYNSYADNNENFDHYFCRWVNTADRNVEFVVANDYSYCISDTLTADPVGAVQIASADGKLPDDANVRFAWDSKTNELSRAYIAGANNETQSTFLHIIDAEALKNTDGEAVTDVPFIDLQNWIYQTEVKVTKETLIKLVAEYAGKTQYFKGGESTTDKIHLISSTANSEYKLRLIYNFKCNHLVAAVVLEGGKEITEDDVLGADLMVVRKDQGQAEQLTFNPNATKLDEVGTAYAVMTFTRDHITNKNLKTRERSLYWVSFPFDVKIADVFGFGEYAEHWIMQYYDGAERAAKGLFIDSGSYWKYITDTKTTLRAGVGYVLALDLDKMTFPNNVNDVSLYFPSTDTVKTISGVLPTEHEVPAHECTIDREFEDGGKKYNHKFTDSHWNLIGVPGFADIKSFDVTSYHFMQDDASFFYNFDLASSSYNVESSATNFQAMYAYMVQFAGNINWKSKTVSGVQPKELAARRNSDSQPEKLTLRLELAQADKKVDQTFVQLQEEGATDDFDMSMDLTKIINKGSNIYTLVGTDRIQVAGNVLPMQEQIVPVGVVAAAQGEYSFRMPDGTEGMIVELIDYVANTCTNLLLLDYTIELNAGTYENRFALHIQPEKSGVSTDIEQTTGGKCDNHGVQKYIIDGHLYLKKDGILYDAQGRQLILHTY